MLLQLKKSRDRPEYNVMLGQNMLGQKRQIVLGSARSGTSVMALNLAMKKGFVYKREFFTHDHTEFPHDKDQFLSWLIGHWDYERGRVHKILSHHIPPHLYKMLLKVLLAQHYQLHLVRRNPLDIFKSTQMQRATGLYSVKNPETFDWPQIEPTDEIARLVVEREKNTDYLESLVSNMFVDQVTAFKYEYGDQVSLLEGAVPTFPKLHSHYPDWDEEKAKMLLTKWELCYAGQPVVHG